MAVDLAAIVAGLNQETVLEVTNMWTCKAQCDGLEQEFKSHSMVYPTVAALVEGLRMQTMHYMTLSRLFVSFLLLLAHIWIRLRQCLLIAAKKTCGLLVLASASVVSTVRPMQTRLNFAQLLAVTLRHPRTAASHTSRRHSELFNTCGCRQRSPLSMDVPCYQPFKF
jgi:hypothetical protein